MGTQTNDSLNSLTRGYWQASGNGYSIDMPPKMDGAAIARNFSNALEKNVGFKAVPGKDIYFENGKVVISEAVAQAITTAPTRNSPRSMIREDFSAALEPVNAVRNANVLDAIASYAGSTRIGRRSTLLLSMEEKSHETVEALNEVAKKAGLEKSVKFDDRWTQLDSPEQFKGKKIISTTGFNDFNTLSNDQLTKLTEVFKTAAKDKAKQAALKLAKPEGIALADNHGMQTPTGIPGLGAGFRTV